MIKHLFHSIVILIFIPALLLISCGEEQEDVIGIQSINPPDGSTIFTDSTITVTFDRTPRNLAVSPGEFNLTGKIVSITGPFSLGNLEIELNWDGGNKTVTFTVEETVIPEDMALIPAGEFQLGSVSGESGNIAQSGNTVHIDAFYIDIYEVTNAQFKTFIESNSSWQKEQIPNRFHDGNYLAKWSENTFPNDIADHPVVYVSWYAAAAYALWVEKRLPTEAEWEKAARGGVEGQKYPWGNTLDDDKVNYSLNVGITGATTPVGDFPENGYGLYDIVGNVLEWCLDEYEKDFYLNPSKTNPFGGNESIQDVRQNYKNISSSRSIKGGSWVESGQPRIWITYRRGNDPASTSHLVGFRCAKSVTQ